MPPPRRGSPKSRRPGPHPKPGSKAGHKPASNPAPGGVRLQRVLADAGVASRRACEALIESGAVEVNGEIVHTLPAFVDPATDRIRVDGRPVKTTPDRHLYILLNKPAHTLSTVSDEPGSDRRTVLDLVDHPAGPRLFPVGRLDYDSLGLVLLTNDGELANKITHPSFGVPKTYRVLVKGAIDQDAARELERGIFLAERKAGRTVGAARTARIELEVLRQERDSTHLELTLREGRNRQVRRMLSAVGYPVKRLERVAIGPLRLKGVARGAWRELTAPELRSLRKAAASGGRGPAADDPATKKRPAKGKKPASGPKAFGSDPDQADQGPSGPSRRSIRDAVHRNSSSPPPSPQSPPPPPSSEQR